MTETVKRYAIVHGARSRREVEAYLPDNYTVIYAKPGGRVFVIAGRDAAGWTFNSYVKPRLASGLIWADEIDLSHPIMKEVPA